MSPRDVLLVKDGFTDKNRRYGFGGCRRAAWAHDGRLPGITAEWMS